MCLTFCKMFRRLRFRTRLANLRSTVPVGSVILKCTAFLFLLLRPPPSSTLFPYTTLFRSHRRRRRHPLGPATHDRPGSIVRDRKSTRLNSSHLGISYAVFCLKKKKKTAMDKM